MSALASRMTETNNAYKILEKSLFGNVHLEGRVKLWIQLRWTLGSKMRW